MFTNNVGGSEKENGGSSFRLTNQNKIEIDQDNVQTPPMARKNFISPTPTEKREPVKPTPCKRILSKSDLKDGDLETVGEFNRFSPARRTRRQA